MCILLHSVSLVNCAAAVFHRKIKERKPTSLREGKRSERQARRGRLEFLFNVRWCLINWKRDMLFLNILKHPAKQTKV